MNYAHVSFVPLGKAADVCDAMLFSENGDGWDGYLLGCS